MDNNLRRMIILDHYQNPKHKGLIDDDSYVKVNMNNESCIDEVNVMLHVKDGIIDDVLFDGEACAICTSSSSIMTSTLIGKKIEEAEEIINNFYNMIDEKEYNKDILEDANVYDDIYRQPNRKKCALLSWWAVDKALKEYEDGKENN